MFSVKVFVLAACLSCCLAVDCNYRPQIGYKNYFPPSGESHYPRVYNRDVMPKLGELTVCAKIRPYIRENKDYYAIMSYATESEDNQILIMMRNSDDFDSGIIHFEIYIGGEFTHFDCYDYNYYSDTYDVVCVTWSSQSGNTRVYLNSYPCYIPESYEVSDSLYKGKTIPKGGVLIIGQDQDSLDGGFSYSQSFNGYIIGPHFWNEEFNQDQIYHAGGCYDGCPPIKPGNVFGILGSSFSIADGAIISPTKYCA